MFVEIITIVTALNIIGCNNSKRTLNSVNKKKLLTSVIKKQDKNMNIRDDEWKDFLEKIYTNKDDKINVGEIIKFLSEQAGVESDRLLKELNNKYSKEDAISLDDMLNLLNMPKKEKEGAETEPYTTPYKSVNELIQYLGTKGFDEGKIPDFLLNYNILIRLIERVVFRNIFYLIATRSSKKGEGIITIEDFLAFDELIAPISETICQEIKLEVFKKNQELKKINNNIKTINQKINDLEKKNMKISDNLKYENNLELINNFETMRDSFEGKKLDIEATPSYNEIKKVCDNSNGKLSKMIENVTGINIDIIGEYFIAIFDVNNNKIVTNKEFVNSLSQNLKLFSEITKKVVATITYEFYFYVYEQFYYNEVSQKKNEFVGRNKAKIEIVNNDDNLDLKSKNRLISVLSKQNVEFMEKNTYSILNIEEEKKVMEKFMKEFKSTRSSVEEKVKTLMVGNVEIYTLHKKYVKVTQKDVRNYIEKYLKITKQRRYTLERSKLNSKFEKNLKDISILSFPLTTNIALFRAFSFVEPEINNFIRHNFKHIFFMFDHNNNWKITKGEIAENFKLIPDQMGSGLLEGAGAGMAWDILKVLDTDKDGVLELSEVNSITFLDLVKNVVDSTQVLGFLFSDESPVTLENEKELQKIIQELELFKRDLKRY
jgi:hypothetical protein